MLSLDGTGTYRSASGPLSSFIHSFSRLIGFGACLLGAAVCFSVAFLTAPLIPIRPAKFALALRSVKSFLYILDRLTILPPFQPGQCLGDVWVRQIRGPRIHSSSLPTLSSPASPFWWVPSPTSNTFCPRNGYLSPPLTSQASHSQFTSPYL